MGPVRKERAVGEYRPCSCEEGEEGTCVGSSMQQYYGNDGRDKQRADSLL